MWPGRAQQQELIVGLGSPSRVLQSPPVQDGSPKGNICTHQCLLKYLR